MPFIRAAKEKAAGGGGLSGLLHVVSSDKLDRASMAREIMAESKRQGGPCGGDRRRYDRRSSPQPAARPLNARLSNAKAVKRLGLTFMPWPEALKRSVAGVLTRG